MTRMRLEVFPHPFNIALDGCNELIDRVELDHRTKELNRLNFNRIAVDFSVEIEDMRFARRGRVGKRRRNPTLIADLYRTPSTVT